MDSYMETQFHHHHHTQHQQHNSGLLRFRSAPTSLFNELTQTPIPSGDELLDSSYETKPDPQSLNNSQNRYLGSGQHPKQHMGSPNSGSIQRSNSLEIERHGGLNLNRQSSFPAGLFSHLMNPQNGYAIMRGLGNFRVGSGTDGESNQHLSRLSRSHLPQIPEIANENSKETTLDEDVIKFRSQKDEARFESLARFPFASLNDTGADSSHLSENGGLASRPNLLVHHLSLPKTSAEMAAVEKLFHFQDTVPFKVRAKRGRATHPRSIAERVRRNRIAERMRKLQELVPSMDKQTNTADMLDLAVEYIKCLQNQQKVLRDSRAKCKCVYSETFTGKLNQAT